MLFALFEEVSQVKDLLHVIRDFTVLKDVTIKGVTT